MKKLVLGTRGSKLALAQSQWVANLITEITGVPVELKVISTKGDRIIDKPLAEIGGKGLFTVELEAELFSKDIDFAVHSLKDLPTEQPEGLCLGAIPKREDPRDALVGQITEDDLVIGTGSLRRQSQLRQLYPKAVMKGIRGNVDTRIAKMEAGEVDCVVLAMAGLNRLSIKRDDIRPLSFEESIPAAGQGALGIQCLTDRADVRKILQAIHDPSTETAVLVERSFLEKFGGGCHVAAGCIAKFKLGMISATAFAEIDGQVKTVSGEGTDPVALGESLAEQCLANG